MTEKQAEALEKLNRGIQESRQMVQQQTMTLAQGYFDDSVEALKQEIEEGRATLEGLPDQIPGGREESFQMLFQELMDNYANVERCLDEARTNVSNLDIERIGREAEIDATDAARREAEELGVDLTEVEGSGSDGRIIVSDVVEASKDAARRRADELGVDISQLEGSGAGGLVSVKDVEAAANGARDQADEIEQGVQETVGQAPQQANQVAQQAQDAAGQAAGQAQQAAGQATDQAGQVAGRLQDAAGGAVQQAQGAAGQVTDQAGQATQGIGDTVGGLTGDGQQEDGQGGGGPLGGVTDQVGQVTQGVQDAAGQAPDQAGQVAGQVQDAAGEAAQQGHLVVRGTGAEEPKATNAARRKAEAMGVDLSEVQGTGSGGLITIKDVTGS